MDLEKRFNSILSEMPLRKIAEVFEIGKNSAVQLKKGKSVKIDSDKLIKFLNKI